MTSRKQSSTTTPDRDTPDREDSCSYLPVNPDGSIYYPSGHVGKTWLLVEEIRALTRRTLDPESAERLLVELEQLLREYGIYKPADWPD